MPKDALVFSERCRIGLFGVEATRRRSAGGAGRCRVGSEACSPLLSPWRRRALPARSRMKGEGIGRQRCPTKKMINETTIRPRVHLDWDRLVRLNDVVRSFDRPARDEEPDEATTAALRPIVVDLCGALSPLTTRLTEIAALKAEHGPVRVRPIRVWMMWEYLGHLLKTAQIGYFERFLTERLGQDIDVDQLRELSARLKTEGWRLGQGAPEIRQAQAMLVPKLRLVLVDLSCALLPSATLLATTAAEITDGRRDIDSVDPHVVRLLWESLADLLQILLSNRDYSIFTEFGI